MMINKKELQTVDLMADVAGNGRHLKSSELVEAEKRIAELESQLACALEALTPFASEDACSHALSLIEDDEERYPKSHNPQAVKFYDEDGSSGLHSRDFIRAKETLVSLLEKKEDE